MDNKITSQFTKVRFFIILLLVFVAIACCVDLTYIFYKTNYLQNYNASFCAVSELIDCDGVAKSAYSLSFGVPNAVWGLFVYSIILMLLFVDKIQTRFKNTIFDVFENPRSYIATLSLLTFSLSMILAFISIFKINKICVLCFVTYFLDLAIAITANSKGFFLHDIKTTIKDFIKGAKKHFLLFLVVLVAFVSTLVYLSNSLILSPKLRKEKVNKEFYSEKNNKYAIKGNILGKNDAPVEIKIYSDFKCPFCRVLNVMVHKIAQKENVLITEVNYPLDRTCNKFVKRTLGGHDNSCLYAKAALSAKKQGKYWGAVNVLFYSNAKNANDIIKAFKKAHLGLDVDKFVSDLNSPEIEEQLQEEISQGVDLFLEGTPAIQINGILYNGGMPYEQLIKKVQQAQKRVKLDAK